MREHLQGRCWWLAASRAEPGWRGAPVWVPAASRTQAIGEAFAGSHLLHRPGSACVLVPVQILWLLGGRLSWSEGELVSSVWAELLTRTLPLLLG